MSVALAGLEGFLSWVSDQAKEVKVDSSPAQTGRWVFYSGSTLRALEARDEPILEGSKGMSHAVV